MKTSNKMAKVHEDTNPMEIGLIAAELITMEFIPIVENNGPPISPTVGEYIDNYLNEKEDSNEEVRCLTIHLKTAEDKAAMRERPYG